MNPSTAMIPAPAPVARARLPKLLWVLIGLMAVTIAAMGAALVWRAPAAPAAPALALAAGEAALPPAATAAAPNQATHPAPDTARDSADSVGAKPAPVAGGHHAVAKPAPRSSPAHPVAPANGAQAAPGPVAAADGSSTAAPREPLATQPAVVSVCNSCGIVEAVDAIKREGKASGLGAVAGGVVGGAVGNRMGGGSGKTAMTVLGAIGGGLAGNAIEKHAKSETVYRVKVRMEDGSVRTVTQTKPLAVGSRVTVNGEVLKLNNTLAPSQAAGSSV